MAQRNHIINFTQNINLAIFSRSTVQRRSLGTKTSRVQLGIIIGRTVRNTTFEVYNLRSMRIVSRGQRDCHLYEADTEVKEIIQAIDADNIGEHLTVPKIFIQQFTEGQSAELVEIVDA